MITIAKIGGQIATNVAEVYGLNKDIAELQTEQYTANMPNASVFYAMDTGDVFMFDEENSLWILQD